KLQQKERAYQKEAREMKEMKEHPRDEEKLSSQAGDRNKKGSLRGNPKTHKEEESPNLPKKVKKLVLRKAEVEVIDVKEEEAGGSVKVVELPDGRVKQIFPDGTVAFFFQNGSKKEIGPDGVATVTYPNG